MAEDSPLLPLSPVRTRTEKIKRGVTFNRFMIILLLVLLSALSAYFTFELNELHDEIHQDEDKFEQLQGVVESQAAVIARFKDSVSNNDVLKELALLQANLNDTEKKLTHQLNQTQAEIRDRLTQTLSKLDETVHAAQTEIQSEVEMVKDNVEQYVRTTQDQFSMENSFMVYQLAGTFTLLSVLISMWHMTAHLRRLNQPFVQRKILAILWMCPIYSITSWFSLVFPSIEGYLAIIKDFYEAYVIYQFLSFLIAVLGRGDRDAVVDLLAVHADHLTPPFRLCGCCSPDPYDTSRKLADGVLLQCQMFAMQFVFLRPLTTTSLFILNKYEYYGLADNPHDYKSPQFWLVLIQNLSVFVAFTGLLKFYHAVHDDLAWCKPWPKFMTIKGVVFMTFWQGLAISILAETTEVIPTGADGDHKDPAEWGKQAQNFLICLEMLLFSIAHFQVFPTEEWEEGYRPRQETLTKFGDNIALRDFFSDLKLILTAPPPMPSEKSSAKSLDDVDDEGDSSNGKESPRGKDRHQVDEEDPALDERKAEMIAAKLHDSYRKVDGSSDTTSLQDSLRTGQATPEAREATKRLISNILFLPDQKEDTTKLQQEESTKEQKSSEPHAVSELSETLEESDLVEETHTEAVFEEKEELAQGESAQEEPVQEKTVQEEPTQEVPTQEEPTQEEPTQEEPTQDEPTQEEPTQEEPTQEEPTQEELTQEEPAQEEPTQEEPTQEEPTQEEPTQEEPTQGESEIQEEKNEEVAPRMLEREEEKGAGEEDQPVMLSDETPPVGQYMGYMGGNSSSTAAASDEPPNERTSLLGGSDEEISNTTPNDEILRPSIFTTIAKYSEKDS